MPNECLFRIKMSRNLGGTAVYSSHMFTHMGFFVQKNISVQPDSDSESVPCRGNFSLRPRRCPAAH